MLSYFGHKFDGKELILRYYRTEPKKFAVAENFYPQKWEVHVLNFRQNSFQVKFETPKRGMHIPCIQIWQVPPPWASYKQNKCLTKYPLLQNILF